MKLIKGRNISSTKWIIQTMKHHYPLTKGHDKIIGRRVGERHTKFWGLLRCFRELNGYLISFTSYYISGCMYLSTRNAHRKKGTSWEDKYVRGVSREKIFLSFVKPLN